MSGVSAEHSVLAAGASPGSRLKHYMNARVNVYYDNNAYSDLGTLTYMDNFWVELTKDSGERLLIPTSAIRIVKLIEPAGRHPESAHLLRPAAPDGGN
ncbi:MAG: hypothetical protein RMJ43_04110 [Chloroherpetonaceae bacterium]|nr:hypothetical protein [Chthonomonadaceae bacterium]MDW8206996.1 hypothetical protein [Chloroherpetonaceae bacterium]